MIARKFMSLATAASIIVASGAVALTMTGCGEEENVTIQKSNPQEELKGSMDYMKEQLAKKKGKKK